MNHSSIFDFEIADLSGNPIKLEVFRGKVLLIVNVASLCGLTPQYEGLEALSKKYKDKGLEVLGFPCNQFGSQEPGKNEEIASFCRTRFDIGFQLFTKIDVNGPSAHPLFVFLKESAPGILGTKVIKWNFTKFLIDRSGQVMKRFSPTTTPSAIEGEILKLL